MQIPISPKGSGHWHDRLIFLGVFIHHTSADARTCVRSLTDQKHKSLLKDGTETKLGILGETAMAAMAGCSSRI